MNMTTRRTASLPNTSKVAEKNGGQGRGQSVAAGSGSWQMLSAAPRRPDQGGDAWCGVFMTDLAPHFFARRLKGHHAGPRRPARLHRGRASPFLKVTSLAVLDVGSGKALLVLRNLLTLSGLAAFCWPLRTPCSPRHCQGRTFFRRAMLDSAPCSFKKNVLKSFSPLLEVVVQIGTAFPEGSVTGISDYSFYIYFY